MRDPTLPVRENLKYAVKLLRLDTARLNAALEETDEQREARRARDREYQRQHRQKCQNVSEMSEMSDDVRNLTSLTESDKTDISDNLSDSVRPTDSLTNQLTNTPPTPLPPKKGGKGAAEPEGFDAFWDAYGRKESRAEAVRAFGKAMAKPSWPGLDAVLAIVASWRRTDQWTHDGGRYQPMAATWLNQERWLDELPPEERAEARRREMEEAPLPIFEMH